MQQLPKVAYSPEFRDRAVKLHLEESLTIAEISKRLSLPKGTLKNWVAAARQGKLGEVGKGKTVIWDGMPIFDKGLTQALGNQGHYIRATLQ